MQDEEVDIPLGSCVEVVERVNHRPTGDVVRVPRVVGASGQQRWEDQSEGDTVRRQVRCMALAFLVEYVAGSNFEVRQEVGKVEEETRRSEVKGGPCPWR